MRKFLPIIANISLFFSPLIAAAQTSSVLLGTTGDTFSNVERNIISFINVVIPVCAAASIVFFFYGLFQYVRKSGDAKGRAQGRDAIIWGLVAMFVIFAFWGIVNFIAVSFLSPAQLLQGGYQPL